ncbi:hypothetical protein K0M31_011228 [Melipona bicolor]|uniref:Uncharacterized protein n=1 Tax=Melipona bicolor TaxID=60889 RepID=A0AA40KUJ8_9HYME|nr:hypothetical protein K0M31_011228 [Melipona bicolor]
MCVKPMEENEEDKVVSMIINYFTARFILYSFGALALTSLATQGYVPGRLPECVQLSRKARLTENENPLNSYVMHQS